MRPSFFSKERLKMSFSTLFWRPVNLFREKTVSATSKHTSNRGLARLALEPSLSNAAIDNLVLRINSGRVTIRALYRFAIWDVATAIKKADLLSTATVLSQATKGKFPFEFKAEGEENIEHYVCHHDGDTLTGTDYGTYQELRTKSFRHYNLPFFRSLREWLGQDTWQRLVLQITNRNTDLGNILNNLDSEIEKAQERLKEIHPLPPKTPGCICN
jgi:hypothetical protein